MVTLGPTYQEQQLEYRLDRINAVTYTRSWIGPKATLDAIAAVEKVYAESVELRPEKNNGVCTLVARYVNGTDSGAAGEIPVESQEIDTAAVQQSIFLNPAFQVLTPAEQVAVRAAFEKPLTRDAAFDAFKLGRAAEPEITAVTSPHLVLAQQAFDHMVMGAETFDNYYYVLNRTRKCSRRYTGKLDLTRINKLWTTDELHGYTGNALLFDVPTLTCTTDETAKGLVARWRMSTCRVNDVSDGSRQMNETWQLAKWSSVLYSNVSL